MRGKHRETPYMCHKKIAKIFNGNMLTDPLGLSWNTPGLNYIVILFVKGEQGEPIKHHMNVYRSLKPKWNWSV